MRTKFIIDQLIDIHGYVSIDQFMKLAIREYYANENSIGGRGDFITAPEVNQMFGEIVGAWCASKYLERDHTSFSILEMGPGRGTMMLDILRATKNVPGFHENLQSIILLENSLKLGEMQANTLKDFKEKIIWIASIEELEFRKNLIVVANEFFDALPIKQFQYSNNKWNELGVIRKTGETNFEFAQVRQSALDFGQANDGDIIEVSPASELVIAELAESAEKIDALIIDYGYFEHDGRPTMQAVKNHKHHNPLEELGTADITAHVDFKGLSYWLREEGFEVKLSTQGEFLKENGIELRAERLIQSGAKKEDIQSALDRLMDHSQMGTLFKVLEASS